jgi:hypothetical protein
LIEKLLHVQEDGSHNLPVDSYDFLDGTLEEEEVNFYLIKIGFLIDISTQVTENAGMQVENLTISSESALLMTVVEDVSNIAVPTTPKSMSHSRSQLEADASTPKASAIKSPAPFLMAKTPNSVVHQNRISSSPKKQTPRQSLSSLIAPQMISPKFIQTDVKAAEITSLRPTLPLCKPSDSKTTCLRPSSIGSLKLLNFIITLIFSQGKESCLDDSGLKKLAPAPSLDKILHNKPTVKLNHAAMLRLQAQQKQQEEAKKSDKLKPFITSLTPKIEKGGLKVTSKSVPINPLQKSKATFKSVEKIEPVAALGVENVKPKKPSYVPHKGISSC